MSNQTRIEDTNQIHPRHKSIRNWRSRILALCATVAMSMLAGYWTWAQSTPPVLTIAPTGTNQFSITITNGLGTGNYELWWTPVLASPDYPWMAAAVGTTGQTNFTLNMTVYQTGFFRALLDTNAIPLWEAADPNNPNAGILSVWIDSPANGSTLN